MYVPHIILRDQLVGTEVLLLGAKLQVFGIYAELGLRVVQVEPLMQRNSQCQPPRTTYFWVQHRPPHGALQFVPRRAYAP
jgi:hypothetical protein